MEAFEQLRSNPRQRHAGKPKVRMIEYIEELGGCLPACRSSDCETRPLRAAAPGGAEARSTGSSHYGVGGATTSWSLGLSRILPNSSSL